MNITNRSADDSRSVSDAFVSWNINGKESAKHVPGGVFIVILFFLGLPGNSLVLYVYQYHFKPSTANMFIKMLATFDILCCIFGITFETVDMFFPLLNGEPVTCKLFRTIEQAGEFISCEVLTLIAYDRYLHICKPLKVFSTSKARRLVYVALVVGSVLSLPSLLLFGTQTIEINQTMLSACSIDSKFKDTTVPFVYYLSINTVLVVCFCLMTGQYICIWAAISKWRHTVVGQSSNVYVTRASKTVAMDNNISQAADSLRIQKPKHVTQQRVTVRDTIRKETVLASSVFSNGTSATATTLRTKRSGIERKKSIKTVITLFTVTAVYITSYIPYLTLLLLWSTNTVNLEEMSVEQRQVWEVFYKSYFLSNALNPIIYSTFDERFRTACYNVLFRNDHYDRRFCRFQNVV